MNPASNTFIFSDPFVNLFPPLSTTGIPLYRTTSSAKQKTELKLLFHQIYRYLDEQSVKKPKLFHNSFKNNIFSKTFQVLEKGNINFHNFPKLSKTRTDPV